ncbi:hypothetical protein M9434_003361 [Picochlorum sp. BPE23]|nr:hypothetical protein M9434_003361 [Picochlorum sp. BPE23]
MLRQLADICLQGRSLAAAESPGLRAAVLSFQNFVIGPDAVKRYFCSSPGAYEDENLIRLNNLRDNPGATHQYRRVGRGIGSSKGKTSGRGHKGQKSRSGGAPKLGFEGGQTPMRLRVPKRGFHNPFSRTYHPLNLDRLSAWLDSGRLDPSKIITMKDLRDSGAVRRDIGNGVKILGSGSDSFAWNVKLEVSQVSRKAKEAIEKAGGEVTTVYYNALGLRALTRPEWFEKKGRRIPKPARPPPKLAPKFDRIGSL